MTSNPPATSRNSTRVIVAVATATSKDVVNTSCATVLGPSCATIVPLESKAFRM